MALELKGVEKRYPHGAVGAAGVDLIVEPGQFLALFGSSGSGKTTILHIAGLLLPPDAGEVLIDDERVDGRGEGATAAVRRSKLGFVFQSPGLLPLLSAEENVDVSLRLLGVGGRSNRDRVQAALNAVEMGARMTHRPDELSGGEQQRVAIARALVHAPRYLIADEPTGELDTKTGAGILGLLKELAQAGTAVLMASHDPAAVDFVDQAMFVTDGLVTQPDRADLNQWIREGEGPLAHG